MTDKWLDAAALDRMVSQDRHDEDDYLALFAQAREALRLRARLADAERERDEARNLAGTFSELHDQGQRAYDAQAVALTASQAQVAALREALADLVSASRHYTPDAGSVAVAERALATPHDASALRALLLKATNAGWQAGYRVASMIRDGHSWYSTQENECAAVVARALAEPEGGAK